MQSRNGFVASLFVFAFCALVAGGISLYQNIDFWLNGQVATMELTDPDEKVVSYEDVLSTRSLDVTYVSEAGRVDISQKAVSNDVAERLVAGQKIPITYVTNNPNRIFYQYQRPSRPWIWLAVGFVALGTAIYALRMLKRSAGTP